MPLGYFTDSTPLTPLRDPFNVLVDGINNVETAVGDLENSRALQTFRWADATERAAQTGMQAGDMGYQMDTGDTYLYTGSVWSNTSKAFCTVSLSANQTLTGAGTYTAVPWDVEISDAFGMHSPANPTRLVAPTTGVYEMTGQLYVSETTGAAVGVRLRLNGTTSVRGSWTRVVPSGGAGGPLQIAISALLSAGDYIEVMVAPAGASALLVGGTSDQSAVVTMKYLGP